ncbi:MAG: hypothetical protein RL095_2115 [Verrucomicrobiota bacterium]|jgi:Xaa-Pro aminopeptidase
MAQPIPDAAALAEFAGRRAALSEAAGEAILLVPSAYVHLRNADTSFPFFQESDFRYLCGFPEPDSLLVIDPLSRKSTLFVPPKDPERELWDGFRFGAAGAQEFFGVDAAFDSEDLGKELPRLLQGRSVMYSPPATEHPLKAAIDSAVAASSKGLVPDLRPATLARLRRFKSPRELGLMRRAAAISSAAHVAAMRAGRKATHEYQIEAAYRFSCLQAGARHQAYEAIVATGANACCLHYQDNNAAIAPGDLILIDAGCEVEGYASDITRTWPVSGRFTGPARDLYALCLQVQKDAIARLRPGIGMRAAHLATSRDLAEGLRQLGLLSGSLDEIMEKKQLSRFYPHGTSHHLGLDVHDVYRLPRDPKIDAPLEAGMVITVEPGLYVQSHDLLAPAAFRGIGIRIEDDVLISADGSENLTAACPKEIAELESILQES